LAKQVMTTLLPHTSPISTDRGLLALPSKVIVVLYARKARVPVPHFQGHLLTFARRYHRLHTHIYTRT